MTHPLSRDLTRAAEAAGALRALMLAADDGRIGREDREAIRRLCAHIRWRLDCIPWRSRTLARTAGALAGALGDEVGERA